MTDKAVNPPLASHAHTQKKKKNTMAENVSEFSSNASKQTNLKVMVSRGGLKLSASEAQSHAFSQQDLFSQSTVILKQSPYSKTCEQNTLQTKGCSIAANSKFSNGAPRTGEGLVLQALHFQAIHVKDLFVYLFIYSFIF